MVPHAGRTLTAEAVVTHVRERLAGFKKPRHVVFREALPRLGPTEKEGLILWFARMPSWFGR